MPKGSAILLGDLAGRIDRLEIRCSRCNRHGRVWLSKLIEQYGADMRGPEFAVLLAKDCPKANAHWGKRCWIYFPQMTKLFLPGEG